ncbi:rCG63516 [Rattus norvegicus]|uniref:RCG63516 n=1 Tax=Rattus norvegicus TaxID=10116 RepID=A6HL57_RAT|nr:rCG63516 [Rattus norvegicus]
MCLFYLRYRLGEEKYGTKYSKGSLGLPMVPKSEDSGDVGNSKGWEQRWRVWGVSSQPTTQSKRQTSKEDSQGQVAKANPCQYDRRKKVCHRAGHFVRRLKSFVLNFIPALKL